MGLVRVVHAHLFSLSSPSKRDRFIPEAPVGSLLRNRIPATLSPDPFQDRRATSTAAVGGGRRSPFPGGCHTAIVAMAPAPPSALSGDYPELNDDSDFEAMLSPDGLLSICGFGSLLSENSARSTFPNLRNFRIAKLEGFRRVFAHVAPVFFERGIANRETKEVSSLSVEPCDGESLVVTVFEIEKSEIPSFVEREHEFRFVVVIARNLSYVRLLINQEILVTPTELGGTPLSRPAVLCARYSDEEYFQVRCKGRKELYFQRYGCHNVDKIWRDDILPCRVYLRHCVLAAKNLDEEAYNNFLDHTFLGDRKTSIRQYLASSGSGIMEEEPPEELKSRYGG